MDKQLSSKARENVLMGIVAAILTPVTTDLRIDAKRLVAQAQSMLEQGCSGVSTFGTTGEGVAFTRQEKAAAHAALLDAGIKPHQILPAIMSTAIDDAADQLRDAVEMGCTQVLILPPFYYPTLTAAGLSLFLKTMYARAGEPDIGLILYNIPALSRITLTIEMVRHLIAEHGERIIGLKDSTGDLASGHAFTEAFPDLDIFTGDDRVLPHLVKAGGAGLIGGMPNLYAKDIVALYHGGDTEAGRTLAATATRRISDIDAQGGLVALKSTLATRLGDPEWSRMTAPIGGGI